MIVCDYNRFDSRPRLRLRRRRTRRSHGAELNWHGAVATAMIGLMLLAALAALLASSGCVPAKAIEQAAAEAAISAGHVRDDSLPLSARQIAQDGYDAWFAQYGSLTGGEEIPKEIQLEDEERVE
jgi:hypothetical protein